MSNELESRFSELERRVARLEDREGRVFCMLDSRKDPLQHFILEKDLDARQVKGIMAVMESSYQTWVKDKRADPLAFLEQMKPHMPPKAQQVGWDWDFVKGLLVTFTLTGQFHELVEHLRSHFNVPPANRLG